jgi:hypothetical protein
VDPCLGAELSAPALKYQDRKRVEDRAHEVVRDLVEHLAGLDPDASGELQLSEHQFRYEPSPLAHGYATGGVTDVFFIPEEGYLQKVLDDVQRKADQQAKLPPAWLAAPYVVAYDNRDPWLMPGATFEALVGSRAYVDPELREDPAWRARVTHPPQVLAGLKSEWRPLLESWGFGSASECRFLEYGALLSAPWAGRLSGVLITHAIDVVQWLPNPFATEAPAETRLLDLGLPVEPLGAAHAAWHRNP